MNIITVTLNPAIDVQVSDDFKPCDVDRTYTVLARDSGGKGVNVSRTLKAFLTDSVCCIALGEENAKEYLDSLLKIGMNLLVETVPGKVRENLHANTPSGDFVLAGQGACVDNSALLRIKERLFGLINKGDFICFCGGLPPNCDKKYVLDMLCEFKERGAKIIIDSRSFDIDDISLVYPYMIKPNLDELRDLFKLETVSGDGVKAIAKELCGKVSESVFITLGADGAVYACADGLYEITAPRVEALSTTGAGDSLIGGYLYALSVGMSIEDTLVTAVAFGTAACLRAGTLPPLPSDANEITNRITIRKI